ncbi:uncharacterized protein TRIVIDRAFT_187599 [Trichoderma virens Gv29-8]|uniref:DUF2867 domain-containing protein n=1 Tax=Hypocrea virens (strain Gv29-8 / FGSC 10586) TaxID=413071 RepID=G9NC63_HYPVG|nr:uncharacterized protein TRIVIDRAFT_187599 [Trichoderma virens Gv29-8]EHK15288.1 hypothetical protein TRIVIDRAFT_187599 [Trichoderma virens Gv29-8]UKZ51232.1 hypothetical protein TrVGV298_004990 [Trichoderma virens]
MPLAAVRAVALPSESKLRSSYKSAYFIDAYAVTIPPQSGQYKPETLARALFSEPPAWFSLLMWIRDRVMSIFGVKSSTEIQAAAETKGIDTISIFPIISRAENEIIMGENDSHLDFQISILIRENQLSAASKRDNIIKSKEIVAMTVVHCHGFFGKAYIMIIKAFHTMIVKYMLARVPDKITADDH